MRSKSPIIFNTLIYFIANNLKLKTFIILHFAFCFLQFASEITYKYDFETLSHNVYIGCKEKVKKAHIKIIDGNITIKIAAFCKSNEQKAYSIRYPVFNNEIKLLYKVKSKIYQKTIKARPKNNVTNYKLLNINLKNEPIKYYKNYFLFNYLFIIFISIFSFFTIKNSFNVNKKMGMILTLILLASIAYLFLKIDIYIIKKANTDTTVAPTNMAVRHYDIATVYKVFGGRNSRYNLEDKSVYLYPINGDLTIDFYSNCIDINAKENLFIIYSKDNKKLLFLIKQ